jgi:5-methylcytosine-specific restriction enzyme subunit McrC
MKVIDAEHRIFEISEWESVCIDGLELSPADSKLVEDVANQITIVELKSGVNISAQSWIGVLRFDNFELRIVPKLAGENIGLIEMIEFTTGISGLKENVGARTLDAQGSNLFDLLSLLFAKACEKVSRIGLLSDYVEREDTIQVLRGRLLADKQILRHFGQVDKLECRYDEFEKDILENQVLSAVLEICARKVGEQSVKRNLRVMQSVFDEICDPSECDLESVRHQIIYNRRNEHYREALDLAWLLLDGLGIKDITDAGKTRCFAFLIDMNTLFENFVYKVINLYIDKKKYKVLYQQKDRSIIWNAITNRPYSSIIPDIMVESRGLDPVIRIPVDAKYKLYDGRKISPSDIYQCFMYAYAYKSPAQSKTATALLIYPSSHEGSHPVHLRVQRPNDISTAEIIAIPLSIPKVLLDIRSGTQGGTIMRLMEIVEMATGDGLIVTGKTQSA